jgi:hypothetical protein
VGRDQRANYPNRRAGKGESQSLAQNHAQDMAVFRPKRKADSDLMRALDYDVGNNPVNPSPARSNAVIANSPIISIEKRLSARDPDTVSLSV